MPVTRVPSLTEMAIKTDILNQEASVRNPLSIYSKSEVDAAISAGTTTILPTLASISGALDSRIDILEFQVPSISAQVAALNVEVDAVSAGASTDIYNLDVTLTDLIYNHVVANSGTPTITATRNAWGKITNISGGPYFIALYK